MCTQTLDPECLSKVIVRTAQCTSHVGSRVALALLIRRPGMETELASAMVTGELIAAF